MQHYPLGRLSGFWILMTAIAGFLNGLAIAEPIPEGFEASSSAETPFVYHSGEALSSYVMDGNL